jgi:hypothetical protein
MTCSDCLLTPIGWAMLQMELERLRREEPDGTWQAEVCQRCEQVTVIYDLETGWSLGSRSTGPVRTLRTLTRRAPEPADPPPQVVVSEAGLAPERPAPGRVPAGLGQAWAFTSK